MRKKCKPILTISFIMYKPLQFFTIVGMIPFLIGLALGIRFLVYFFMGDTGGLILASTLLMMGFMTIIIGLQADIIAKNRKILEDVQYHVRKLDYDKKEEERGEIN